MLPDSLTGATREVDVHIVRTVAGHAVRISVECIDHARRAGSPWVDQMHGKHQHLPTDRLVLASRSGFTGPAEAKARALGIDTIDLTRELPDDAARIVLRADGEIWTVEWSGSAVRADVAITDEVASSRADLDFGTGLFRQDGSNVGILGDLVDELLTGYDPSGHALASNPPMARIKRLVVDRQLPGPGPDALYLVDQLSSRRFRLEHIRMTYEITIVPRLVPLEKGLLGDTPIGWGRMTRYDKPAIMVISEAPDRPRISFTDDPDAAGHR